MNSNTKKFFLISVALLVWGICGTASAQSIAGDRPPANVAGNWSIYARNFKGTTDTKSVQLVQNGNQLTGHFKGPYQSGGLVGTINGQHIVFRTKTRDVLTFRGVVDGNTIRGTFGNRGLPGEFEATRMNE